MRLKVGDVILDQFKDTIIAQNYEVNSFGDVTTRNGGFTNDFIIPLTSNNEQALGFPSDLNISTREPYEKINAQLIDGGAVIAIGYLRYKLVTGKTIKCSFFSTNTEWFNLIKDKKMGEINLSAFDHIWDYSTISTAISQDKTGGFVYPIVDYGFFKGETLSTTQLIPSNQLFPGIFIHTLVTQIFADIGWTLSGELVEYNATNVYGQMIQPFSAEDFVHSQEFLDDNTINLPAEGGGFTIVTHPPAAGTKTDFDGLLDIAVLTTAKHTITVNLEMLWTYTSGSGDILIIELKNGASVLASQNLTFTALTETKNSFINYIGDLTVGDLINVNLRLASGTHGNMAEVVSGNILIEPSLELLAGSEVQMSAIMPDILQSDFLQYVFLIFGVVPQPNNYSKILSLDLFNSIKENIPIALDWSNKLDTSKNITKDFTKLLNNYSAVSIFNYEEDDNDQDLVSYTAETKQGFGQGQFNIDNQHLDPIKDIYTSPYSPMINILSFSEGMYLPQIKFYGDTETPGTFEKEFEPNPKVGLMSENIGINLLTAGVATTFRIHDPNDVANYSDITEVPFAWFAKTSYIAETNALNYSLAFDQVLFPGSSDATLIETYLEDQESILNNMKYVSAYFKLDESDINELDFMIPIYIDRFKSYFYINKVVNYRGANMTTNVELVRIS